MPVFGLFLLVLGLSGRFLLSERRSSKAGLTDSPIGEKVIKRAVFALFWPIFCKFLQCFSSTFFYFLQVLAAPFMTVFRLFCPIFCKKLQSFFALFCGPANSCRASFYPVLYFLQVLAVPFLPHFLQVLAVLFCLVFLFSARICSAK